MEKTKRKTAKRLKQLAFASKIGFNYC